MESVFQDNMSVLKHRHLSAWKAVTDWTDPVPKARVVVSEAGSPNILVEKEGGGSILVHDQKEPGSESLPFMEKVTNDFHGTILVFGMGLGYIAKRLLDQREQFQYLIIFEADLSVFKLALSSVDLNAVLSDDRVIICAGVPENVDTVLKPATRALMLEDIHTHKLLSCFQINEAYEKLASMVFDHVSALNIDGSTRSNHGRVFIENRLRHLTSMHHDRMLEELTGKFSGVPALMIAAGPSLDKNIDQIHKAMGKSVIIAVDTALPVLLAHGIVPDFVTAIDFNDPIFEKIAPVASKPVAHDIKMICTSWVACSVPKVFPAKAYYWAFGGNPLERWIQTLFGGKVGIGGAGTVAHLNFAAAVIMGCDPLIFVGQDLAHSYDREHASNVVFTGTETMEKVSKDALWVKGVDGKPVVTTRVLHGYRVLFEQWIEKSDRRVINASQGGAWIQGADHMLLADAIESFCHKKISAESESGCNTLPDMKKPMDAMLKRIQRLEKTVNKAERLTRFISNETLKLQKKKRKISSLPFMPGPLRKKIIELDSCYNMADKNKLWEIFDEMTMGGLKFDERKKREIEKLEGEPEHYLEWLLMNIDRMDRVNQIRKENLDFFNTQVSNLISFYGNESRLLKQIESGMDNARGDFLSLADLYYENGDYRLLSGLLEKFGSDAFKHPRVHFYRGLISLKLCDYEASQKHFTAAIEMDAAFLEKIQQEKKKLADFYYSWAQTAPVTSLHKPEDQNGMYYRLKGLRIFPDHPLLKKELSTLADEAVKEINTAMGAKGLPALYEQEACLKAWYGFLTGEDGKRSGCIQRNTALDLFRMYAKIFLDKNEFETAYGIFEQALLAVPDPHELYISMADVCFAQNDFSSGMTNLKKAVALEKGNVEYFKVLGVNLEQRGDFGFAVMAFEQYLEVNPSDHEILKRLADCCAKLGDSEKAEEIYRKYEIITAGKPSD